ncbi:serine O-acetyltransferase [Trinickia symbiotica]|uniref:serine O-acetyltransferase n=1 Tax=Trinickia symbiotica TaxID=863227 RepID=A0A2N7X8W9_9BURK|nr:serine O-acetyltransferase EpsC [Trinickia symbiotica]PMS38193.1 serine acetyltransferase [Trinickia symbiotica]PPK47117.1 serine O-acetyltransferase [Trinickia symbiotica]
MALFDIDEILGSLQAVRRRWRDEQKRAIEPGGRDLPSRDALAEVITALKGVLFPMRLGPTDLRQDSENFYVAHALDAALHALLAQVRLELLYVARRETGDGGAAPQGDFLRVVPHGDSLSVVPHGDSLSVVDARAIKAVQAFAQRLPQIRALLDTDVIAAYHGDPAAGSVDEVLLCYPGVLAMIHHRLAHELYRLGLPLLARIVAELAHAETGIDIHPGARIGAGFFIDHGTGVVIGETAIIGERVRLYQAVTLGAKRFPRDADGHLEKGLARHPIVEDDVVVYAGATILGRVTIGRGATIGGNVWITHDVAPGSHVTQASLRNESARSSEIAVGLTIGAHG